MNTLPETQESLLFERFRVVEAELDNLAAELRRIGEYDLSDACKRARREFELVARQGIPQARGV